MQIEVLSRRAAEHLSETLKKGSKGAKDYPEPLVVISIKCPADKDATIQKSSGIDDILRLSFFDIDDPMLLKHCGINNPTEDMVFNETHAKQILDFVEKYQDRAIICHCCAGISRSAGVAAALSKIYNGDDSWFFKHYIPNRLVYRIILGTHYNK